MFEWLCKVCGYSCSDDEPPATCPACGAARDCFEAADEGATDPDIKRPALLAMLMEESSWRCQTCGYAVVGMGPPSPCPVCGVGPEMFDRTPSRNRSRDTDPALSDGGPHCAICESALPSPCPNRCPVCASTLALLAKPTGAAAAPGVPDGVARRRYAIIGSGVAAVAAAEQMRKHDPDSTIVMLSRERCLPYQRLNLTRYLGAEVDAASLLMHPPQWYERNGIDVLLDTEVTQLDVSEHRLRWHKGELRYDRLVLATGARVAVPPLEGVWLRGVVALRSFADATRVLQLARTRPRVVVIGGGLLGLEAAYAMQRQGCDVTVCEGADRLMPRQLDGAAARLLLSHLEAKGLHFVFSDAPQAFLGEENARGVRLASGRELSADLVLLSSGVLPNVELARRAGLRVARGVEVDDFLTTSGDDVLAAGDVAEHRGALHGLWSTATAMGTVAGRNAVGARDAFTTSPPSTLLKVVDLDVLSIGRITADGPAVRESSTSADGRYLKLVIEDGRLVGAIAVGDISEAMQLRRAVQAQVPLQDALNADDSLDALAARIGALVD